MTTPPNPRVAVCVVTFQRPQGLRRLLRGIAELTFDGPPPRITMIVVDNDESQSARAVCEELRAEFPWPLQYHVEPRRGIPFARNTAVSRALEWGDLIAFIDDDEVADPCWLDELLTVQRRFNADVVTGPVLAELPADTPSWMATGRFFDSPRYRTGQRQDVAYTHNVLARRDVFHSMDTIFDERMAMTGGTDSHFFRRVHRAGFSIVWADEAVVREIIPKTRTCFRWLVQRAFRAGNGMPIIQRDLRPSWTTPVVLFLKALVWMVIGIGTVLPGLFLGRHVLVRGIRKWIYGVGLLAGLAGIRYEEYRTTHGG